MRPIPTIQQITTNITSDIVSRLNLSIDYLKKVYNALALVIAAQLNLAYLYLRDIQDNVFPNTATTAVNGGTLERQGKIYLNRNPFPDSIGSFNVAVTGVAGSVLRVNITFKSNDDALNAGQLYILDSEYTLTGTADVIEVRSIGAGVDYNLNVADRLTITEPVIGVDKTVTVTEVLEQPKAGEDIEAYRLAILKAIQIEPQGGSRGDYMQWASDAQGVRRIYPYVRDTDASFVDIYVEATIADSTDGKGTPTPTILQDVEDVIEQDPDPTVPQYEGSRRPMQADVTAIAINLVPVDITITGLQDDVQSVKDTIETAIKTLIYDVRPFISGADLRRNKNDILYTGKVQSVVTDVLSNGNYFNTLDLFVAGNAEVSYEFTLGDIPYLRNLIFV
jgi:uncharacterized phage protein gp47/JayE